MKLKKAFIVITSLFLVMPVFAQVGFKTQLSEPRKKVVLQALSQGGKPYIHGSNDPANGGFDCSGLVQWCFKTGAGIKLPRTAAEMYSYATKISVEEREPGDLMFFMDGGKISHVGIYCGKYTNHQDPNSRLNGKVVFVNTMSEGAHPGVFIADIEAPYWKRHFYSYGRVLPPSPKVSTNNKTGTKTSSGKTSTGKTSTGTKKK